MMLTLFVAAYRCRLSACAVTAHSLTFDFNGHAVACDDTSRELRRIDIVGEFNQPEPVLGKVTFGCGQVVVQ